MLLSKPVKVHEEDEPRIVLRFAVANRDQSRTHFSALGNIAVSCRRNVNAGKIRVKFNISSIAGRSRFYISVAANFELIDELTNVHGRSLSTRCTRIYFHHVSCVEYLLSH